MEHLATFALLTDVILFAGALEAYRRRLAFLLRPRATQPEFPLMRPRAEPDEFPFSETRLSMIVGFLTIWTGAYREENDLWLARFVWSARAAVLAMPILLAASVIASANTR